MKRICMICEKYLGEKEPFQDKRITHGLCGKHKKKLDNEIDKIGVMKND